MTILFHQSRRHRSRRKPSRSRVYAEPLESRRMLTTILQIEEGDFNGDGLTDLASRDSSGAWTATLTSGTPGSRPSQVPMTTWTTALTWHDIMVSDFNRDGRDEIAGRASNGSWWMLTSDEGATFFNQRIGHWSTHVTWEGVVAGQFFADGYPDTPQQIAGRTHTGSWYLMQPPAGGNGLWNNVLMTRWSSAVEWNDTLAGDMYGIGSDQIVARSDRGQWWSLHHVANGSWQSTSIGNWSPSADWQHVQAGFFADASSQSIVGLAGNTVWLLDIANPTQQSATTSIGSLPVNRTRTISSRVSEPVSSFVVPGDFNGDGRDDLAGRDPLTGDWTALVGQAGGGFTPQSLGTWDTALAWERAFSGRFQNTQENRFALLGQSWSGSWQMNWLAGGQAEASAVDGYPEPHSNAAARFAANVNTAIRPSTPDPLANPGDVYGASGGPGVLVRTWIDGISEQAFYESQVGNNSTVFFHNDNIVPSRIYPNPANGQDETIPFGMAPPQRPGDMNWRNPVLAEVSFNLADGLPNGAAIRDPEYNAGVFYAHDAGPDTRATPVWDASAVQGSTPPSTYLAPLTSTVFPVSGRPDVTAPWQLDTLNNYGTLQLGADDRSLAAGNPVWGSTQQRPPAATGWGQGAGFFQSMPTQVVRNIGALLTGGGLPPPQPAELDLTTQWTDFWRPVPGQTASFFEVYDLLTADPLNRWYGAINEALRGSGDWAPFMDTYLQAVNHLFDGSVETFWSRDHAGGSVVHDFGLPWVTNPKDLITLGNQLWVTRDQWWTRPYYEWTIAADGTVSRGKLLATDHPPIAYTGWNDLPIASSFWRSVENVRGDLGGHTVLLPTGYLPDDILTDSAYATSFRTNLAGQITDYIDSDRLVPGVSSITFATQLPKSNAAHQYQVNVFSLGRDYHLSDEKGHFYVISAEGILYADADSSAS